MVDPSVLFLPKVGLRKTFFFSVITIGRKPSPSPVRRLVFSRWSGCSLLIGGGDWGGGEGFRYCVEHACVGLVLQPQSQQQCA